MKVKKGISAFLVVYNEEKVIERCLKSLVGVVDEIIVIHDGLCDDKTLEIAKKYTKKVRQLEHKGMGELYVIEAIQMAQFSWILRMDADEFLSDDLRNNIRNLIKNDSIDAYTFIWKIWNGKKYISEKFPFKKSFCRKENSYFIEFPGMELETRGVTKSTEYVLEHMPLYNNYTLRMVQRKWRRWAKVHAEYYVFKKIRSYNCPKETLDFFLEKIQRQTKFAYLIACPFWFLYSFLKSFFVRKYFRNIKTWKVAFFQGFYGWYLCYFISKEKRK